MKIYLVQHGEAVTEDIDPERPLSDQGKKDVENISGFLKRSGAKVSKILHSGKLRALQTADILANKNLSGKQPIPVKGINPKDPVIPFITEIQKLDNETLIVGHLPFMAILVSHMVTGDEVNIVQFQPGSIVCLEQESGNHWKINWMVRPDCLA